MNFVSHKQKTSHRLGITEKQAANELEAMGRMEYSQPSDAMSRLIRLVEQEEAWLRGKA